MSILAPGRKVLNVEKIESFPGFPECVAGFDLGPIVGLGPNAL